MANNLGLSIGDVVNVQISLSPSAAALRSFGNLLIVGDSNVIDTQERIRSYSSLTGVGLDFSQSMPEYQAAQIFFSQSPPPPIVYIGRWAASATSGLTRSGILSAAQQTITNFNVITNGGMTVMVDGVSRALTGINLSSATNLNAVAAAITVAFGGTATLVWDSDNADFILSSNSTGTNSSVGNAIAPASGTDLSTLLRLQAGQSQYSVAGISTETPAAAAQNLATLSNQWYGMMFASTATVTDDQYVAAAGYIQGTTLTHVLGITTQDTNTLGSGTTDLASRLSALDYSRTVIQYSSTSPYAIAGFFGVAFTVDFTGTDTTITMKFKDEAGVTPETLSETQAQRLQAKNCNVYVYYNNSTAIIQEGVCSSGDFFDTVQGADWLQNFVQTAVYNLYKTSPKVPQTDAGLNQVQTATANALSQGVTNGLIAPGQWNGPPIGPLKTGAMLTQGFFVYSAQISAQNQADRAARKAPPIQAALKLAGAFHNANVIISFNP